jgi:hypothetical protein
MSDTEMAEVTSVTAQRREDQSKGQEEQGPQPALSGTQLTALGRSVRVLHFTRRPRRRG